MGAQAEPVDATFFDGAGLGPVECRVHLVEQRKEAHSLTA